MQLRRCADCFLGIVDVFVPLSNENVIAIHICDTILRMQPFGHANHNPLTKKGIVCINNVLQRFINTRFGF